MNFFSYRWKMLPIKDVVESTKRLVQGHPNGYLIRRTKYCNASKNICVIKKKKKKNGANIDLLAYQQNLCQTCRPDYFVIIIFFQRYLFISVIRKTVDGFGQRVAECEAYVPRQHRRNVPRNRVKREMERHRRSVYREIKLKLYRVNRGSESFARRWRSTGSGVAGAMSPMFEGLIKTLGEAKSGENGRSRARRWRQAGTPGGGNKTRGIPAATRLQFRQKVETSLHKLNSN